MVTFCYLARSFFSKFILCMHEIHTNAMAGHLNLLTGFSVPDEFEYPTGTGVCLRGVFINFVWISSINVSLACPSSVGGLPGDYGR